jgi:hypothetical protein
LKLAIAANLPGILQPRVLAVRNWNQIRRKHH